MVDLSFHGMGRMLGAASLTQLRCLKAGYSAGNTTSTRLAAHRPPLSFSDPHHGVARCRYPFMAVHGTATRRYLLHYKGMIAEWSESASSYSGMAWIVEDWEARGITGSRHGLFLVFNVVLDCWCLTLTRTKCDSSTRYLPRFLAQRLPMRRFHASCGYQ